MISTVLNILSQILVFFSGTSVINDVILSVVVVCDMFADSGTLVVSVDRSMVPNPSWFYC
jgi:hypothetical protein